MEKKLFDINGTLYTLEGVVESNHGYDYTDGELLEWLTDAELHDRLYMDSVGVEVIRVK